FLIGSVLAGLGALGALMMRSGKAPLPAERPPAERAASNGAVSNGTTGSGAAGPAAPGSNGTASNGTGSNVRSNGSPHRSPERDVTPSVSESPPGIA
ncbi:MAG: hypothetical protein ACRDSH_26150, partial [Pseudonocardiaceae bacterium]